MNYLRGAFIDAKLKYRVNKTVGDATNTPTPQSFALCVALADEHPHSTLTAIKDRATYSHPNTTYRALTLLEHLVGACNYAFHEALAHQTLLQEKLVQLAVRRAEDDAHRRVQRLCRLTLLEYSRMFADDKALQRLSTLAKQFEKRTHKNLLRCLNVQNRRITFREVSAQDIVMMSPMDGPRSSVGAGVKDLAPLKFSKAEVWLCHVCGYMNAPAAQRCAACETARATGNTPPTSSKSTGGADLLAGTPMRPSPAATGAAAACSSTSSSEGAAHPTHSAANATAAANGARTTSAERHRREGDFRNRADEEQALPVATAAPSLAEETARSSAPEDEHRPPCVADSPVAAAEDLR